MKWKKTEDGFLRSLLAPLVASIRQPVISAVVKGTNEGEVRRARRGNMNENFYFDNIETTNCFKYEAGFNVAFSRNNLLRIKDAVYVLNLDDEGTYWVLLFADRNAAVYFDSFGI